jgi:triosephosphate isomerase
MKDLKEVSAEEMKDVILACNLTLSPYPLTPNSFIQTNIHTYIHTYLHTCIHFLISSPSLDEPVWAIGTGLVCPPSVAQEVHQFVRGLIEKKYGAAVASKTIIQYGGSVKPDNVKELMACPDIDGCLVGGASLTPDSFAKIVKFKDQK